MQKGLTSKQAKTYLNTYGLNQLPEKSTVNFLRLITNQFKNMFSFILIFATLISFLIGDHIDGYLIGTILLLNTLLGFWQEYKASKELAALRKLEVATSRVVRDGVEVEISSKELVPGDIVLLENGDKIPADGEILEAYDISVNESSLTGESLPVTKSTDKKDNSVYFGTTVTSGRAKMQVTKTGADTKFGKITLVLADVKEESTPLEIALNNLAKKIGIGAILISLFMFGFKITQGEPVLDVLFSSIALMVAVVPEGFPAIITVLLALGVRRMYQRKTLVRRMSAVESLGATNIICADKTGTLTMNQMSVAQTLIDKNDFKSAIHASVICNSASLAIKENHGSFDILGDTTEGALLLWAKKENIDIDSLRGSGKIIEEIPFDLKRRRMTVVWQDKDGTVVYSKGAPESILPLCTLSKEQYKTLESKYKNLASKGLRVLAIASKKFSKDDKDIENNLQFLGLVGIADMPHPEAAGTIAKARSAGIEVVMITGDNELTAKSIAEDVGLLKEGDEILTGEQLDMLTDDELIQRLDKIRIFARVLPEHKLRIVQNYQRMGKVVAVTGDGVNDALALKQAQVGIAMGQTGTDVAKESADIIITDDNLSTIVAAIEQGRIIYNNILKIVKFLMAGNLSEMLVIVIISLAGYPAPLLPVQILWINFVSDGLPALSLAADQSTSGIMQNPSRGRSQSILNYKSLRFIFLSGSLIALFNISLFLYTFHTYELQTARIIVFTSMVFSQMIFIFFVRGFKEITSNKYLIVSVTLVIIMQLLILFLPFFQVLFKFR